MMTLKVVGFTYRMANERSYPLQEKGTLLVFPSYMPHGVEPVTKGLAIQLLLGW
jgi:hypothetical protein